MVDVTEVQVGIIADTSLQRHILSHTITAFGYKIALNLAPERITTDQIEHDKIGVWLVDLSDEDEWADLIDLLVERSDAPVLFGDSNVPAPETPAYRRWEKRLLQKIENIIGKPVSDLQEQIPVLTAKPANVQNSSRSALSDIALATRAEGEAVERVWVLGASLGGPAAVKDFLDCLPQNLPVAFVLAQHIDGGFQKVLAQVLGRDNHFAICDGCDNKVIQYGTVYIAPVEHEIDISHDGRIINQGKVWQGPYAPSIDQVIQNVSRRYGPSSGAIIFSGMGSDGAEAVVEMKKSGGIIWTQSIETCANSSMPESVRETGCVSYSAPPQQLAFQLVEYIRKQEKDAISTKDCLEE